MQAKFLGLAIFIFGPVPSGICDTKPQRDIHTKQSQNNETHLEGEYILSSIREKLQIYTLEFTNVAKKEKIQSLKIETKNLHAGLKVGMQIKLAATVEELTPSTVEALEILTYLPTTEKTSTPVWILSAKKKQLDMRGVSYLKMHAPDFYVL